MADTKWWTTLPPDVQSLLNLVQVWDNSRERVAELQTVDLLKLRKTGRDFNKIIDNLAQTENDLSLAIYDYKKAGGNFRKEIPNDSK